MKKNTIKIASESELKSEIKKAMQLHKAFHWGRDADKSYRSAFLLPSYKIVDKNENSKFYVINDKDEFILAENVHVKFTDVFTDLGYLAAVVYISKKGDSKHPEYFFHSFKNPLPILATCAENDGEGKGLFITGGKFRIEADGIID